MQDNSCVKYQVVCCLKSIAYFNMNLCYSIWCPFVYTWLFMPLAARMRPQELQGRRKDFLIGGGGGGAQSETTHRVVSNLYNNL